MKSRIIDTSTGTILYTSNELLHLREGETYVADGKQYVVTGKVENTSEGEVQIKSFYVRPWGENEMIKLDE